MNSAALTELWWKKDKNGIEFLAGTLNAKTKVLVLPNTDKKSEQEADWFLYIEPKETEESISTEQRFRF